MCEGFGEWLCLCTNSSAVWLTKLHGSSRKCVDLLTKSKYIEDQAFLQSKIQSEQCIAPMSNPKFCIFYQSWDWISPKKMFLFELQWSTEFRRVFFSSLRTTSRSLKCQSQGGCSIVLKRWRVTASCIVIMNLKITALPQFQPSNFLHKREGQGECRKQETWEASLSSFAHRGEGTETWKPRSQLSKFCMKGVGEMQKPWKVLPTRSAGWIQGYGSISTVAADNLRINYISSVFGQAPTPTLPFWWRIYGCASSTVQTWVCMRDVLLSSQRSSTVRIMWKLCSKVGSFLQTLFVALFMNLSVAGHSNDTGFITLSPLAHFLEHLERIARKFRGWVCTKFYKPVVPAVCMNIESLCEIYVWHNVNAATLDRTLV